MKRATTMIAVPLIFASLARAGLKGKAKWHRLLLPKRCIKPFCVLSGVTDAG